MIEPAVHWQVSTEGLKVYRGSELVALIPIGRFGQLIFDLASHLKR